MIAADGNLVEEVPILIVFMLEQTHHELAVASFSSTLFQVLRT